MLQFPFIRRLCMASAILGLGVGVLQAQTATGDFEVTITIEADCEVTSTETLNFGTIGVLTDEVTSTADLEVTCTPDTAYEIGLNEGTGDGATTTIRKMTAAGGETIDYQLFQDSGHLVNWGNDPDPTTGDTLGSTGTGSTQTFPVYGLVPAQETPPPDTYSDTITVTVTF